MITRGEYFKRNRYTILFWTLIVAGWGCLAYGHFEQDLPAVIVSGFCFVLAIVINIAGRRAYRKLQETERRTNTKWK